MSHSNAIPVWPFVKKTDQMFKAGNQELDYYLVKPLFFSFLNIV